MSRTASEVGPTASTSAARCDHGDVVFDVDPDPEYLRPCDQDSVFLAPYDGDDAAGPIRLCAYHLARYLEAVDDEIEAELVARGARHYAADPAFVTLDDAPPAVPTGGPWKLYAIDQHGHAHYVKEGVAVIDLDPTFEVANVDRSIEGRLEEIRRTRGFAAFAPGAALPTGGFA